MALFSNIFFPALGAAAAIAGADKLTDDRGYMRMFRHLGWSRAGMRAVAVAELAGGAMLALPATRAFGGAVLAATSAAVLASEIKLGDTRLAAPRAALLLAALAAVAVAGRRRVVVPA